MIRESYCFLDDDQVFLDYIKHHFENDFGKYEDLKLILTQELDEFLDLVKRRKITTAIVDLRYYDLNGLDILEKVRRLNSNIKLFLVTGQLITAPEQVRCKKLRVEFLFKTQGFNTLLHNVILLTQDRNDNYSNVKQDNVSRVKFKDERKLNFQVGLTFSGKNRDFVRDIADYLTRQIGENGVFYDDYYKGLLARLDLDIYLQDLYRNSCDFIVAFFDQNYSESDWCGLEWRAIRDLIKNKKTDRIILVKLGEFEVEGVYSIDGYLDGLTNSPEELGKLIMERVIRS